MLIFAVCIEYAYYNNMDNEQLYKEAIMLDRFKGKSRILFRGFLLENNEGIISLMDVRSPYYKAPSVEDMNVLYGRGFLKGTTYLLMKSDERKIERYKELSEQQARLSLRVRNPRKKQEYENSVLRYNLEIEYYMSQVRRWQKSLKYN